jgi:hypothetical protein
MNLYLNDPREHWVESQRESAHRAYSMLGEDDALVHYSLGNTANTVLTPNYEVALPSERRRTQQLKKTPETLQRRFQLPPAPRV